MTATEMNHFTILTKNLEKTVRFYKKYLGLIEGFRPPLKFPGSWLYIDNKAVLHIIVKENVSEKANGLIDHLAFSARNLSNTIKLFEKEKIKYSLKRQPQTNVWQMFFNDPNRIKVELDFNEEETADLR